MEKIPSKPIEVVCHRGASIVAPENTLASAEAALAWGAAYLEIDLRTSRDGVFYVIHDATVDRTTDGSGAVEELTSTEIDALDAGSWFGEPFQGQCVPRFESYLDAVDGRAGLYVEIKKADPDTVIDLLERRGMLERCFFWSFDSELVHDMRRRFPGVTLMARPQDFPSLEAAVESLQPEIMEVTPELLTKDLATEIRALGMKVMLGYWGDDISVFKDALGIEIDMVNLDHWPAFAAAQEAFER